jgi:hypothetical protein
MMMEGVQLLIEDSALSRQMRAKAVEADVQTWCVLFLASASTCNAENLEDTMHA